MKRNIIYVTFIILMINVYSVFSQQITEYNNKINSVFQYVDKSRISTGLLYDYGLQLIDPLCYNGSILADTNYVNIDVYKNLYWGMYSSKVNNNTSLQTPDQVNQSLEGAADNAVAIMHIKYDKYRDDAYTAGLVTIQNEQIYDVSGRNPYEQKFLFAVAPKKVYFMGQTVSFRFASSLFVNTTGKTLSSLQISFNNGSSYQTVAWNTNVSYHFSSAGIKDVYFKVNYTDNTSYISRSKVSITDDAQVTTLSGGTNMDSLYIPATSEHSGGKVQIRYAANHTDHIIRKPLIIAEGFDPSVVMGTDYCMDIYDFINDIGPTMLGNLDTQNIEQILYSKLQVNSLMEAYKFSQNFGLL